MPVVLAATGRWNLALPTPDVAREWLSQPVGVGFVAALVGAATVGLWLLLATAVLTHVYTALARRARWTATLRLPGPLQSLTAALLGATAVTAATGAAQAVPAASSSGDLLAAEPVTATPTAVTTDRVGPEAGPIAQAPPTYTVRRGDSLSRIAARTVGDADRWPEIYALNRGTDFPRGGTLRDPNLIFPGWVLDLPTDAATPPAKPRPPTDTAPSDDDEQGKRAAPKSPTPTSSPDPATAHPSSRVVPPSTTAVPDTSAGETARGGTTGPDRPDELASRGIRLPGGSWVALGLACAIAAAVALVWAHRHRRYVPRTPSARPRVDDSTLAPMPRLVGHIRRGLRRPATGLSDPDEPVPPRTRRNHRSAADRATAAPDDAPDIVSADVPEPFTPALASPVIEVWPSAGLGLTGPGAEAAARGFLVSALAAGGLDQPDRRSWVVIPAGTLVNLLGDAAAAVPDTPRLTITDGIADAVTVLEEQALHRSRVCADYEVDTLVGLRDADPMAEFLPPMMLIADTTAAGERARIAALLTQGRRLDIHGVLVGAWPDGDTVDVAGDGTTTPADGDVARQGRHPADVGRLTVIDPVEAADLLRVLAESHTGDPQPSAPVEPAPMPRPHDQAGLADSSGLVLNDEKATLVRESAGPRREPTAVTTSSPKDGRAEEQAATAPPGHEDGEGSGDETAARPDGDDAPGASGRVGVQVLGDARIIDVDTTQPLRGKSLELLVYLAARGGTASQEAILEDLLPEAASSKAPHRLHTYVYNLRRVLKSTGGPATYLSHPGRRYILHREAVAVDLWRMSNAIDEANRATTPAARVAALRRAVDAYQGPLASGKGYEWVEPYREAVQRQASDAALALADALDEQPGAALAVLTTAIRHHPHAEALYQAAMRAHAALGDAPAIRDLHRQLARSLDEIDTEVSDETTALAGALIGRAQRGQPTGGKGKAAA
ncbi:BTAD domain-containing putative transcriptional regulator [Micromonospora sp. DT233]|uniref:BTAD domain-containing putative transcriptional regulator n=1 Tax=Micromonospora sp. DT233 TaxID=3393432 RepID=UPI003CEDC3E0